MKRIINGKVYDTKTAEHLAGFFNGLSSSDFDYVDEDLYRTKKGEFFLVGEGGAASKWGKPHGGGMIEGKGIKTLCQEEALEWCEEHNKTDVIIKYFSHLLIEA